LGINLISNAIKTNSTITELDISGCDPTRKGEHTISKMRYMLLSNMTQSQGRRAALQSSANAVQLIRPKKESSNGINGNALKSKLVPSGENTNNNESRRRRFDDSSDDVSRDELESSFAD